MADSSECFEGGCSCGQVRYRMLSRPIIVHCCHCRKCQQQTGTAFALNALIESSRVELVKGGVTRIDTPSPSGKGQGIVRCPECKVAVWSHYFMGGISEHVSFIRVGTLDNPDLMPPDVHIFTSTKQPWVILPPEDLVVDEFYDIEATYSKASLERRKALLSLLDQDS